MNNKINKGSVPGGHFHASQTVCKHKDCGRKGKELMVNQKNCEEIIYEKASNLEKPRNQYIQEAQWSSGTGNTRDSTAHILWNYYKPAMQTLSQADRRAVFPTENQHRGGSTFLITNDITRKTGEGSLQNPDRKYCQPWSLPGRMSLKTED